MFRAAQQQDRAAHRPIVLADSLYSTVISVQPTVQVVYPANAGCRTVVQPTAQVVFPTAQVQSALPTASGQQQLAAPNTTTGQTTASIGVDANSALIFSLNGDLWS